MATFKTSDSAAVPSRMKKDGKPARGAKRLGKKQMKKTLGGGGRAYNFHEDAG